MNRPPKYPPARTLLSIAILLGLLMNCAAALADPLERFYGRFEGQAVAGGSGELSPRDITVEISPKGKGFTLEWTAVVRKSGGKEKRSDYSIDFLPSKREGLYSSAMRKNLFGNPVPLDPMKGDPYVWSKVDGDVLVVHALLITEEGGFELQAYRRTLKPGGMTLQYNRIRDNVLLRAVDGDLKRVK